MVSRMKSLVAIFISICVLVAFAMPGCTQFQSGASAPSTSMETELLLSNAPVLGKPVQVTFTFALREGHKLDAKNTTAKIMVPEGFEVVESDLESREELIEDSRIEAEIYEELVDEKTAEYVIRAELERGTILIEDPVTGDKIFYKRYTVLEWYGDVLRDKTYTIQATIKAVKTGYREFRGKALFSLGPGSLDGGADHFYVAVFEDSAEISDLPLPRPPAGVPRYDAEDPEKPPVIIPWYESPPLPEDKPGPPPPSTSSSSGVREGFENPLTIKGRFYCHISKNISGHKTEDTLKRPIWGRVYIYDADYNLLGQCLTNRGSGGAYGENNGAYVALGSALRAWGRIHNAHNGFHNNNVPQVTKRAPPLTNKAVITHNTLWRK